MLLYHADVIDLDIFRTNHDDKNISDSSSYLDLSPVYGYDCAHQIAVRQMKDGLLKPDPFAENRLLQQPLEVCIYLIMYSRFHRYVAKPLLSLNENGRISMPPQEFNDQIEGEDKKDARETAYRKRDEDLFQAAKLITCGLYIDISIHDYPKVLMRRHVMNTSWTPDPRIEMPEMDNV